MTQALQRAGHNTSHKTNQYTSVPTECSHIRVQLLSPHVKEPTHSTLNSTGLGI